MGQDGAQVCCKALTADCLACAAGMNVEQYCQQHQGTAGCQTAEEGLKPSLSSALCSANPACPAGKIKNSLCCPGEAGFFLPCCNTTATSLESTFGISASDFATTRGQFIISGGVKFWQDSAPPYTRHRVSSEQDCEICGCGTEGKFVNKTLYATLPEGSPFTCSMIPTEVSDLGQAELAGAQTQTGMAWWKNVLIMLFLAIFLCLGIIAGLVPAERPKRAIEERSVIELFRTESSASEYDDDELGDSDGSEDVSSSRPL